jgi:uracil-DNA glycosylase family 4
MFTGDGSGDFLYPVLHEAGLASQPVATRRGDGMKLIDARITAVVHCAPPGDKPRPEEFRNCARHLAAELEALRRVRVVVCLGRVAWEGYLREMQRQGVVQRMREYTFAHGAEYELGNGVKLLGSYHPSLRNTNTGVLTREMLVRVMVRAAELAKTGI